MRCTTHLYGCSSPNVDDFLDSPRDPTMVSRLMVRQSVHPAHCVDSLPENDGQTVCPIECSSNGGASICR
ncbi:hypothetical protein MTR_4g082255 [Medicago truncatula]|uniref:Uncharacterized protein n=1 Tax=Medicago truncatula TaxID=3880 RepID=A0A072UP29_MEDTR|nr:hypothetical protein MTR_4g082255 [Medicago truncatula]